MKYLCLLMIVVGLMGGVALGCNCVDVNMGGDAHRMNCTDHNNYPKYNSTVTTPGDCPNTGVNHGPNCTYNTDSQWYSPSC